MTRRISPVLQKPSSKQRESENPNPKIAKIATSITPPYLMVSLQDRRAKLELDVWRKDKRKTPQKGHQSFRGICQIDKCEPPCEPVISDLPNPLGVKSCSGEAVGGVMGYFPKGKIACFCCPVHHQMSEGELCPRKFCRCCHSFY